MGTCRQESEQRAGALASGDDERHARLIDEDRVALVDDAKVELGAQHRLRRAHRQVVAQVVKAELRVGHVRHVRRVRRGALRRGAERAARARDSAPHAPRPAGSASAPSLAL
mgnify:CR=1 FL=1